MVLLIDDDPVNNVVNTRFIKKHFDLNVIVYDDACEAFKRLREWSLPEFPAIIFLDINMPEMDGWEFLEAFQTLPSQVREKCRVVMLTSSIDTADINKAKTYSVVQDFISKPLTIDKLACVTEELLK